MFSIKKSMLPLALIAAVFGINSTTSLAGGAACAGEVQYRTVKSQALGTPIGWNMVQDFDGDGLKDLLGINRLALNSPAASNLVFYKRTAAGYVTAPVVSSLGAGFASYRIITGDLNGDGNLDILNFDTNAAPFNVTAYYGNGNGGFTAGATTNVGYGGNASFAIGDLNGDGKGDLVSGRGTGTGYHLMQGDGTFGAFVSLSTTQTVIAKAADFDANGKTDVLLWNYDIGTSQIFYNQGGLSFTPVTLSASMTNGPRPDHIVDFNGDGRLDIVSSAHRVYTSSAFAAFTVYIAQPSGDFFYTSQVTDAPWDGNAQNSTVITDADGDGDTDIILSVPKTYFIARNDGAGALTTTTKINTALQPGTLDNAVGDPAADVISLNRPGIFNALSDSVKYSQSVCGKTGRTDFIDFDGDGDTDLGFFRPADGYWLFRNSRYGPGGFFPYTSINGFGTAGDIPASQDFNGDNLSDRAFFRPSTGTWTIMDTATSSVSNTGWGANGDRPAPSDYDGDGKADLAVYRPSNGTWWILYSSNGGYGVQTFGVSGDIPVPMDYDGDNISDIAVFRPSTGIWYIQKSTGGYYINAFGLSTDKPVPGDYDNDGSADIAVFRDGQWYVQRIRDGALSYQLWGMAGDVPIPLNHVGKNWGANFSVYRSQYNWTFDMGENSQIVNGMDTYKTISTILPAN